MKSISLEPKYVSSWATVPPPPLRRLVIWYEPWLTSVLGQVGTLAESGVKIIENVLNSKVKLRFSRTCAFAKKCEKDFSKRFQLTTWGNAFDICSVSATEKDDGETLIFLTNHGTIWKFYVF